MRIIILNCDHDPDPESNGSRLLLSFFAGRGGPEVVSYDVHGGVFPGERALAGCDGVLITGSETSVHAKAGWVKRLEGTIRSLDRRGTPTLGICFGFELIAQALGGKVVKKGPLLEKFQSVRLTREGAEGFLFDGFPLGFKVFEYHSDVVSVLPEGASVLARNRDAVQAFAVREMFGVQFHPEITPSLARKLAVQDGEDPREVLNSVRDDYFLPLDVLKNFAAYCEVSAGR